MDTAHNHKYYLRILPFCLCLLLTLLTFVSASAQQITNIDLGVHDLTLEVGESYTFKVTYEPEIPPFYSLVWFASDDSVLLIDGPRFTVEALKPGEADIYAESFDGVSYDVCRVTVSGSRPKDGAEKKSGSSIITLSDEDRVKITSRSINRFLQFLESVDLSEKSLAEALQRTFIVTADVKPGTEKAESQRAYALGMADAAPLDKLNVVTIQGTLAQILQFVKVNENLKEIFEIDSIYFADPIVDLTDGSAAKAMNLEGHVEELTNVSAAHNAGFDGSGTTLVIIDTGINSNHEQFAGRIVSEKCFNTNDASGEKQIASVCSSEDASMPSEAWVPERWNHGSHVAGIAAGRDGIAPKAKIIAINIFSEVRWTCANYEKPNCFSGSTPMCCGQTIQNNDLLASFNEVLTIIDNGTKIAAVNMSFGDSREFSAPCDDEPLKEYMDKIVAAEAIPVSSSGNDFHNNGDGIPSCISSVVSVGALADRSTPVLTVSSNHGNNIDITAPGTDILSSFYAYDKNRSINECSKGGNCYGKDSGTSMASPMVSGAYALLRQAYPDKETKDLRAELISMSQKTVSERVNGTSVLVKPVLDFSGFANLTPPGPIPGPILEPENAITLFRIPDTMQELPRTGFSAKAETALRQQPLSAGYTRTDLTVMIPVLSVESDVLTVPYTENEYPVEWLGSSIGMLEGSAEPGQGVMVFTGHNHLNNTEAGPFAALGSLNNGDRIMLRDGSGSLYSYTVFSNELILATDIAGLEELANQEPNSLTLLTCEEEQLEGGYAFRRVISAVFDGTME